MSQAQLLKWEDVLKSRLKYPMPFDAVVALFVAWGEHPPELYLYGLRCFGILR